MKAAHRHAVETRRLYRFESTFLHPRYAPALNKPRSLRYLRALAEKVWAKHGRKGAKTPQVTIVDGAPWSTCAGYSQIVLATAKNTRGNVPHDTVEVLLHELTHALGHGTHGRGFVRRYAELLVEYGGCDAEELRLAMLSSNLTL